MNAAEIRWGERDTHSHDEMGLAQFLDDLITPAGEHPLHILLVVEAVIDAPVETGVIEFVRGCTQAGIAI